MNQPLLIHAVVAVAVVLVFIVVIVIAVACDVIMKRFHETR